MGVVQGAAALCRKLTAQSKSNFYYAFMFLPPARREALYAVYAYCRLIDDIIDGDAPQGEKQTGLRAWHGELALAFSEDPAVVPTHPVAQALRKAHQAFGIRHEDALAVLQGCEMDLVHTRYETWEELRAYCYHVASAVGLLCIEIFGYRHPAARDYAIELGLALQLTNILRDVAEDAARGRIYLPREDLRRFGVSEGALLAGRRDAAVGRLLRHEAQRARTHYLRAWAALRDEDRRSLLVAEIMGRTYFALLEEIERQDYAVLSGPKIGLPRGRKIGIALQAVGKSLFGPRAA